MEGDKGRSELLKRKYAREMERRKGEVRKGDGKNLRKRKPEERQNKIQRKRRNKGWMRKKEKERLRVYILRSKKTTSNDNSFLFYILRKEI